MIAPSKFQDYLKNICHCYEKWWAVDALTETIAAKQATFSFEQMVQTEEKRQEDKPQIVPLPILKGIQNYVESEHILLVGSPGVGKSTALLRCLVSLAKKELEKPEPRIPVLVPLKRYNIRFSTSEDPSGMLTLIRNALKPQLRLKIPDVEELLFQKRLILLLDGFNEMPADTVRTELKAFREECQYSEVPLICTTRELGSGDLGIKRRLEIQPLNPSEINRFLQECIPTQAEQILQLLSRDNRELSRTPFVLWMLYQLFQEKDIVVETLGEAFRQFFQSFKKYKEDAPVTDERRKGWNRWLEHLAFTMLNNPEPTDPGLIISDQRAEKVIAERFGEHYGTSSRIEELLKYHLLERVSDQEITFHHQLIQEYYAAEYLLKYVPELLTNEAGVKKLKCHYLNHLKWTEPIAIMFGLPEITETYATKTIELALDVDLMLGVRLAGEVKRDFQEQTIGLVSVAKLFDEAEVSDWLQIELVGRTRSRLALPKLRQFLKNSNIDIARKAAAWIGFLGYQEAIPDLLRMLSELDRWIPQENGSRTLTDRTVSLEIEIIEALAKLSQKDAALKLHKLLDESSPYIYFWLQPKLGSLLSTIDPEFSAEWSLNLLENTRDPEQFRQASDLLSQVGYSDAPSKLIQKLHDEQNPQGYQAIIRSLGLFDADEAVSALTNLIKSPDSSIRKQAAKTLIEHKRTNATNDLIIHLNNSDWNIRWCAAVVLGNFANNAAIPMFLEGLLDKEHRRIRITAAQLLGMFEKDEVISALRSSLKDPDYAVRRSAAMSLANFNQQEAIPELLKALRHYHPSDDSPESVEIPSPWQEDRRVSIPGMTYEILNQLGDNEAIQAWLFERNSRGAREQVSWAIDAIQSRYGFYNYGIDQQAKEANNLGFEYDFIRGFYEDIDKVIYQIQENPELRQNDTEDRLTIDIVNQLRNFGYNASHDTKSGGHVDITVRKNGFLWLGEAKIYKDNNYLWEGFLQLTTRYSSGDSNQEHGGLLIYIRDEDASSIMEKWQNYLLEKSLADYSFRHCHIRSLAFISTHRYERSGQAFHVRHIPVMLHFAPKDRSGRRRKESP
ncbi:HEAT repeat domain-containing protein [Coleofasciculus sp.]|uniref:HEAT repeat domain-containing protein n=1 Tax=Coleofasciculus sp. TaxID=3100458 RepID=UPI0039FA4490